MVVGIICMMFEIVCCALMGDVCVGRTMRKAKLADRACAAQVSPHCSNSLTARSMLSPRMYKKPTMNRFNCLSQVRTIFLEEN